MERPPQHGDTRLLELAQPLGDRVDFRQPRRATGSAGQQIGQITVRSPNPPRAAGSRGDAR